jgi:hypothetical protein
MPTVKQAGGKIVCYTGVGAKRSGVHTDAEFLRAVAAAKCGGSSCPKENDADGWIEWSGAIRNTRAQCASVIRQNRRIEAATKAAGRAAARFDRCVDNYCAFVKEHGDARAFAHCAVTRCPKEAAKYAAAANRPIPRRRVARK